jgi:hypothetical protein
VGIHLAFAHFTDGYVSAYRMVTGWREMSSFWDDRLAKNVNESGNYFADRKFFKLIKLANIKVSSFLCESPVRRCREHKIPMMQNDKRFAAHK